MHIKTKKKGFTLIELIVVIAILAILAALALPQYGKLREESQRSVCNANIETLRRCYLAELAVNPAEKPQDAYTKVQDENPTAKCPLDQTYEFMAYSDGSITITCPLHGGASTGGVAEEVAKKSIQVQDSYADLLKDIQGMSQDQLKEYFEERGFDSIDYIKNDNILDFLWKNVYSETWPEMPEDFYKEFQLSCGSTPLYIRPFCQERDFSEINDSNKVFLFASSKNQAKSPWEAYMVNIDGSWYKQKNGGAFYSITNGYDDLKQRIETGELIPADTK